MKYILLLLIASSLLSCKKEDEAPETLFTTFDSLVGDWKLDHKYVIIVLESNPTVITDSHHLSNYAPLSYLKINADSSYRSWHTISSTPGIGVGISGKIVSMNKTLREMWQSRVTYTNDNYITETAFDPVEFIREKIKTLTTNRMVLVSTTTQNDGKLYNWHEVFIR